VSIIESVDNLWKTLWKTGVQAMLARLRGSENFFLYFTDMISAVSKSEKSSSVFSPEAGTPCGKKANAL